MNNYWHGQMMGGGWGWMAVFWWIVLLLIFALVIWFGAAAARRTGGERPREDTPEQVLKRRYAKGEIDRETFQRMLEDLRR